MAIENMDVPTETMTVEVDGEVQEIPMSRVKAQVQKWLAAEKRLEDASAMAKAAESRAKKLEDDEEELKRLRKIYAEVKRLGTGSEQDKMEAYESISRDVWGYTDEMTDTVKAVYDEVRKEANSQQSLTPSGEDEDATEITGNRMADNDNTELYLSMEHMPEEIRQMVQANAAFKEKYGKTPYEILVATASEADQRISRDREEATNKTLDSDSLLSQYFSKERDPDGTKRMRFLDRVKRLARSAEKSFDVVLGEELELIRDVAGLAETNIKSEIAAIPGLPPSAGATLASMTPAKEAPTYRGNEGEPDALSRFADERLRYDLSRARGSE